MHSLLRKVSFWIGMASAVAMLLVPIVHSWIFPSATPELGPGNSGLLSFLFGMAGSIGDGIMVMVWMSGLAGVAALASLIAFSAAWFARESGRTKLLSLLPVAMVAVLYGLLLVTST